jgi:hypothetical protein
VGLRAGIEVAQVRANEPLILDVPGMRATGLARSNVKGGGNDRQIEATFTTDELARLASAAGGPAAHRADHGRNRP